MAGYVFNFKEHGPYDPDGKVDMQPDAIEDCNQAISSAEVSHVRNESPESFAAYIIKPAIGQSVTTWIGDDLGIITGCKLYRQWNGHTYVNMAAVTVRAINGKAYRGRYGHAWADVVTLRKVKG